MHAIVADVIINVVYVQVDVMGLRVYRVMLIFLFLSDASSVLFTTLIIIGCLPRVSMGLSDRRKTAKNLVDSRKNWKFLTVSRK